MANAQIVLTQLYALRQKVVPPSSRSISNKTWHNIFDELCTTFPQASPEERVDIQIAFESRDILLAKFLDYFRWIAQQTAQNIRRGNRNLARELLQRGVIADAIIDGRGDVDILQTAQANLLAAAARLDFDVEGYLDPIQTPPGIYIQRAYQLHKAHDDNRAIQVLGRALQLDNTLKKSANIADLASTLTGESPQSAIITLEDPYLRNTLIAERSKPAMKAIAATARSRHVKSIVIGMIVIGLVVIFSLFALAMAGLIQMPGA
ncbi:MAG: hypothetical protein K8L97_29410 [Anaerolineae bacterium]|nr:hypothetical protein [Anaerolineae bacterium]